MPETKRRKQDKHQPEASNVPAMIKRSNNMISAAQSSPLIEKKITMLAMSRMHMEHGKLTAHLTTAEIKQAMHCTGNSIYGRLKAVAQPAMQHFLYIQDDPNKQEFDIIAIIERVRFKNGVLTVVFNDAIKEHTIDVQKKFTALPLPVLLSIRSNNTYRIYELLSIYAWKIPDGGTCTVVYDLTNLKFTIGLIDVNSPSVVKQISAGASYQDVLDGMGDKAPYRKWWDFKKRILDPAQKEMEESETSDLTFTYKPLRSGQGGKISAVEFTIRKKQRTGSGSPDISTVPEAAGSGLDEKAVEELVEYTGLRLSYHDADALLKRAGGDVTQLKKIYDLAVTKTDVRNLPAWMMSAVGKNWTNGPDSGKKNAKPKTGFMNNCHERDYDFDALEEALLRAQDSEHYRILARKPTPEGVG